MIRCIFRSLLCWLRGGHYFAPNSNICPECGLLREMPHPTTPDGENET